MKPEILCNLIGRMISKDTTVRQDSRAIISQQVLQQAVQRGIFYMLDIYKEDYVIELMRVD